MRFCRSNAPSTPDCARNALRAACRRAGLPLAAVLLVAFLPAFSAKAQSASPKPTPAEPQSQSSSQDSSQSQSQSQPAQPASQTAAPAAPAAAPGLQTVPGAKTETLAEAARQNAQKSKAKPKHVYTDDDLSSMGGAISVVGDSSSGQSADDSGAQASDPSGQSKDETYWRGRADAIKRQIADVDRQIDDKKAEIAKAGPASFDPSAGLSQGVIVIHDRNAELKDLEDRRQSLEDQLDQLADEGRKAGADSGWFR